MKIINVTPEMTVLPLGRLGENEHTKFIFDVSDWLEEYPGASIGLANQLPHTRESYPGVLESEGNGKYSWTITSAELTKEGNGKCQLQAEKGNVIVKGKVYKTLIGEALDGEADPPEPWESWISAIEHAIGIAIIQGGSLKFEVNSSGHLIMSYTDQVPIAEEE